MILLVAEKKSEETVCGPIVKTVTDRSFESIFFNLVGVLHFLGISLTEERIIFITGIKVFIDSCMIMEVIMLMLYFNSGANVYVFSKLLAPLTTEVKIICRCCNLRLENQKGYSVEFFLIFFVRGTSLR